MQTATNSELPTRQKERERAGGNRVARVRKAMIERQRRETGTLEGMEGEETRGGGETHARL